MEEAEDQIRELTYRVVKISKRLVKSKVSKIKMRFVGQHQEENANIIEL